MSQERIELPAGTVHVTESGPPDGPAVVFVHGFLVDGTLWSGVADRLAARGFRTLVPTWPLGAHPEAMAAGADLSPRGVARVVLSFLAALDLRDVVLVGNDTGGAICQFVLDEDASRIGRLVLTNCDAFEVFPPAPFDRLFRLARHPGPMRAALQPMRRARVRNGLLGFGGLVRRPLGAEESARWVRPYLEDAGVRRDTATFARGWDPRDLAAVSAGLGTFERPVLICWGMGDRFFRPRLARRLEEVFRDSRLVELPGARTFLALDEPGRLADEIAAFAS